MRFFSPLILLAVATSAFAAPTERALSKRYLDFNFSNIGNLNGPITVRDVAESHLSKRALQLSFTLEGLTNSATAIKREVNEVLAKRTEVYNLVIPVVSSGNLLSGRSTDPYTGQNVQVNIPDDLITAFEQNGITQEQVPNYINEHVHAQDPATGNKYQLVPNSELASVSDIILNLILGS